MPRFCEWTQPARLFFWPGFEGSEEGETYPNLWDALAAAAEGDAATAWIVTQEGRILSPRAIREMRADPQPRPGRRETPARPFFSWKRAA